MRIGKRLFPYPVLNSEKVYSQYKESSFSLSYEDGISEDKQFYELNNLHCDIDSELLIRLIKDDKAEIICVIECPSTMFRRKYVLPLEGMDLAIPLTDLNNKVNVSAFVAAKEEINDYQSDDFLNGYEDISFTIEKHDILAADDGFVNTIDFDDFEDNKQKSIFLVIKDKNITDGTMRVEYDSDKITICLPEKEWNEYDKTKRISKFESLYFSVIAIPALGYALSCLQRNDPSVDILKIDYRWFNSFAAAYKNYHGEELTDDVFIKMNTNLESQMVLNNPVTKAVDQIFGFTIGLNGGDDSVD
ncbi:MAG: hypothetical protein IJH00_03460 [Erysipelotrichaceae bacterium]|nr:hypothetical protein [Erysipelotrichaceae bacterium]MBQ6493172.1 hypothetical protein [Erysipelotrichaceae bacterium]